MAAECASAQREERPCARGFDDGCAEHLEQAEVHEAFAAMFATVPDEGYLSSMARALRAEGYAIDPVPEEGGGAGCGEAWRRVSVDRARLVRSYDPEGPKPPFQALFCGQSSAEVHSRLRARYEGAGFRLDESVHEPPDQLGVELLYVAALYRKAADFARIGDVGREEDAVREVRDFVRRELAPFVRAYAAEMEAQANTAFFKSFARCLCDAVCAEGAAIGA